MLLRIMNPLTLTLNEFQRVISSRYEKTDRERGAAKTFLWFIEEVGELATALNSNDRQNLEEEFADVFAWLCTLSSRTHSTGSAWPASRRFSVA